MTNVNKQFDKIIKGTPFYVGWTGDLAVPEVLVSHLFKLIFFGSPNYGKNDNYLLPKDAKNQKEKFLIESFRGRKKKQGKNKLESFYGPAYPNLVRNFNVSGAKGNWSKILLKIFHLGCL